MTVKEICIRVAMHVAIIALAAWSFTLPQNNTQSGSSFVTVIIAITLVPGMISIALIYIPLEIYLRKKERPWLGLMMTPILSFMLPSIVGFGPFASPWAWAAATWGGVWMLTGLLCWIFTPK